MKTYTAFKRLFDTLAACLGMLLLLPLHLVLVIVIRATSKGPAVFVQERAGRDGHPFRMLKYRTMRADVDAFGPSPNSGDDPRLTKIGKILRELSLDELPQLFNVLRGDMALVGPRPLYISQMAEWDQRQRKRLLVKPGLTGLAQVSGRGGLTIEEKLELDVQYVENASFGADLMILWATVRQVFGKSSIYEKRYSQSERVRGEGSR